jgi:hypothetical protein
VGITAFLLDLQKVHNIDLTISEWGHEFMAVLVSFLVISKLTLTMNVYFEFQGSLMQMNQAIRDLVQLACAFTEHHNTADSDLLPTWRFDVAYHALLLQMTTVTMLHKTNGLNAWETPGMIESEQFRLKLILEDGSYTHEENEHGSFSKGHSREWVHGHHSDSDLNLRVPVQMAHRLRSTITSHRKIPEAVLHLDTIQEQQLLASVSDFMKGYHAIRKYLTTPIPFPMVQMGRIFLFFYVFTLPFAILSSTLSYTSFYLLVIVFIMTYGFLGLELVSIELDDPFGDDPNDLPVVGQAKDVCEDVYLAILDVDGLQAAKKLKTQMNKTNKYTNWNSISLLIHNELSMVGEGREADPLLS